MECQWASDVDLRRKSQSSSFIPCFFGGFWWRVLSATVLVFQGVAAGSVVAFPYTRCFPFIRRHPRPPSSELSILLIFLIRLWHRFAILVSWRLLLLLLVFFFFYSEINCFFVCVWGVRTIIPSLDALFLPPWFEFLLKKLLHHPWNLSKYELFLLFAFFYSLWILMRRFHSFSRCLYFVSLFRCVFFPFFLSFLRRILAMSSCCCCDFWDCLGGVRNLLSSVPFLCRIFLLRNFFWFCASITSLRFFLFCFCLVFVFVFSPSLILFGSWQAASALLVCASLTSLLFFFPLSFSLFLLLFSDPGKHWFCLPHRSFFLSFLMRVVVWNIRLLPQVGQSHRSLEILLYYSHPSSWTLIRSSLLLLLRLLRLCCALSRMLLLRTCFSIPIHTNAQAHEYNTFVPILSFFSQCLFLLCDDDSTSTRIVIHEFSFQ